MSSKNGNQLFFFSSNGPQNFAGKTRTMMADIMGMNQVIHGVHGPLVIRDCCTLQYHIQVSVIQVDIQFLWYYIVSLRSTTKTGCLGIRILCPSGATYLLTDCCFSELVQKNPTECVVQIQSGHHYRLIECSLFLP